jgi:hypothetical protein
MKNQNPKTAKRMSKANGNDLSKMQQPVRKKIEDKFIDQVRETPFERIIKF